MIWLTWRQNRAQLVTAGAAVAVVAVAAGWTGRRLADLVTTTDTGYDLLTPADIALFFAGVVMLAVVPGLVGAFWGAPMVAHEMETGTYRLVWNQSVTRTRWLATRLGLTALAAAAVTGLLSLAVTWWAGPIDGVVGARTGSLPTRLTPVTFAMRGVVPVAYTLFALVLGVVIGAVVRRTVPAMAITLGLFLAVQIAVPLWVRPHLATPADLTVTMDISTFDGLSRSGLDGPITLTAQPSDRGDWVLSNTTVDAAGAAVELPPWFAECVAPPGGPPRERAAAEGKGPLASCLARLGAEGYRQRLVYQPANRFWTLQWRESALFVLAAGGLAAVGLWWVRVRLS
ncbi:MAG: ABC transporter permease subunit [Acidimicrobiales bacterium]